ncbi:MAG: hypothetical protein AMJ69_12125 [Gammaproteobacteria bacterium SG8_47]|nr:MAG: hypothetical protein AMJ69_12125 [Gammaproteobacteria bacterium SG8_47]
MSAPLMILPSHDFSRIRLVRVPDDIEEHEAFRHATGLIATLEEQRPNCTADQIVEVLEDHGFVPVDFVLGPEAD